MRAGRSMKVYTARPVERHMTDDVALVGIPFSTSHLVSPTVRAQFTLPEPTLHRGGRVSEMVDIARS